MRSSCPRSLAREVGFAGGGVAQSVQCGGDQRPHPGAERIECRSIDEARDTAECDHDRVPHAVFVLVDEAVEHVEQICCRHRSGHGRRPGIVDEHVALERRQVGERSDVREAGAQFAVVGHSEEAVTQSIHDDRVVGRGQRHRHGLRRVEQHRGDVAAVAHVYGDDPDRVIGGVEVGVAEPLLAEFQFPAAVGRRHEAGADEREPRLPDPRVHHPAHGFARRRLDGIPQVVGLGVRVGVRAQIVAHALLEDVGADVLLQHAQQCSALVVREHVEHAVGLCG